MQENSIQASLARLSTKLYFFGATSQLDYIWPRAQRIRRRPKEPGIADSSPAGIKL
jgi:hypothetical protein